MNQHPPCVSLAFHGRRYWVVIGLRNAFQLDLQTTEFINEFVNTKNMLSCRKYFEALKNAITYF